ncbi:hypothetical protein V6N13_099262 [Hibiscus sabdariffa]
MPRCLMIQGLELATIQRLSRSFKGKRTGDVRILPRPILANLDHSRPELSRDTNVQEILDPGDPSRIVDRVLYSSDEEDMLEWAEEDAMIDAEEEQHPLVQ